MKKLLLLVTALTLTARVSAADLPTIDKLLDDHIRAVGGKEAIEKHKTLILRGTLELASGTGKFERYAKAPNLVLQSIEVPSWGTMLEGFDGKVAWTRLPQADVQEKQGAELARARRGAEFYRDLKLKELFKKVEIKGVEKVDGKDAYVVEATPAEGPVEKYFLDTQTALTVRVDLDVETPMGRMQLEIHFEDYRMVNGVKLPHAIRQTKPEQMAAVIKFTEIKHDEPIDDAKFKKP